MAFLELRVDVPTHAHSFVIQIPISSTILGVKQEICRTCVGSPRVEGQRIIWRGRNLLDDERVEDIWKSKSTDELRIILLAVHPSAWSSRPPNIPPPSTPTLPFYATQPPQPQLTPQRYYTPTPPGHHCAVNHTTAFVHFKHENALVALLGGQTISTADRPELAGSRASAIFALECRSHSWPSILDEEFPEATEGGLRYDRVIIEGKCFLKLSNPSAIPTPLQLHALKVLTYTFPILSMFANIPQVVLATNPPHINQVLQQMGLPQIRFPEYINRNPNPNVNGPVVNELQIPFRPLIAPLLMLLLRIVLLLYFVAPARKPVIGIVILAWVMYEGWGPLRDGLRRVLGRDLQANPAGQNAPVGAAPNAPAQQRPPPPAQAPQEERGQQEPVAPRVNTPDHQATMLLSTLATMNLQEEEQAIHPPPGRSPREPGILHKITTFLALLVLTIHPALWDRRRTALKQREGRLRTEANARESQAPSSSEEEANDERRQQIRTQLVEQHARLPLWVRRYMERVRDGEWVDDSD